MQQVEAVGVELGQRTQHAAVHQADDRHQHRVAGAYASNDGDEQQAGGKAHGQCEQHAQHCPGRGRQAQRQQDAQARGIEPAGGAGLDETVAHDLLQYHTAYRQPDTHQYQGRQPWQAACGQGQPGVALQGEQLRPGQLTNAERQ
ncbi:hypothetical protein D3C80_570730 [compost metagenome]